MEMKNQLVAQILNEVADMLDMQGVEFKPRAYRRAARTIESLAQPIEQILRARQDAKTCPASVRPSLKRSER